ncbi:MAG: replication initiator protein A, partial [Clostridia bacterium]|nr:replication initiator protein A [Clostridia bacterium]
YYYENEAEQYLFYRVPQMLFTDKRFSKISSDAKLLYSLFLNRMSLSRKNGMVDEEKRVYIYFSIEEVMEVFGIASQKATKIIAELDEVRGCGLIHRKKSGQGKPARIYVMKYTSVNYDDEPEDIEESYDEYIEIDDNFVDKDSEEYMKSFILEGTLDDPKIVSFSNKNSRLSEIKNQDFRKSKIKTFEKRKSRLSKFKM